MDFIGEMSPIRGGGLTPCPHFFQAHSFSEGSNEIFIILFNNFFLPLGAGWGGGVRPP